MVGVSWRQGGSESLAEFTLAEDVAAVKLREFAQHLQLHELAYLATCNRVELIFSRSEQTQAQDLRPRRVRAPDGQRARATAKPNGACAPGRAKARPSICS